VATAKGRLVKKIKETKNLKHAPEGWNAPGGNLENGMYRVRNVHAPGITRGGHNNLNILEKFENPG